MQHRQRTRVEPSGKHHTNGDVGNKLTLDCRSQQSSRLLSGLLNRLPCDPITGRKLAEVALVNHPRLRVDLEPRTGRQLPDSGKRGACTGNVVQAEVMVQGLNIDLGTESGHFQQGLDLGGKPETPVVFEQEQWLDPERITGQQQLLPTAVPGRQSKHPVEFFQRGGTGPFEKMQHHFGVRPGAKWSSFLLEVLLLFQLPEVVQLAVPHQRRGSRRASHRLTTGGRQVDDTESPMSQSASSVPGQSLIVRSTMDQPCRHPFECL